MGGTLSVVKWRPPIILGKLYSKYLSPFKSTIPPECPKIQGEFLVEGLPRIWRRTNSELGKVPSATLLKLAGQIRSHRRDETWSAGL
jgi:hypothetical protein